MLDCVCRYVQSGETPGLSSHAKIGEFKGVSCNSKTSIEKAFAEVYQRFYS
jgi:hypothetical protein